MHLGIRMASFYDELEKIAFSVERRENLPDKDFAQPRKAEDGVKGKYPIPDRKHARIALGFAKMHHDSSALTAVRQKVEQKYPDMLQGGSEKNASTNRSIIRASK